MHSQPQEIGMDHTQEVLTLCPCLRVFVFFCLRLSVFEESLQRMRTGLGDAGAGDDMLRLRTPPAPPFIRFCNNIKLFSFSFLGDCWKRSLEGDVWKCYWKRKQYSFKKCVFLNRYQTLHKKQAIKMKPWVYKSKSKVKNDMCFFGITLHRYSW